MFPIFAKPNVLNYMPYDDYYYESECLDGLDDFGINTLILVYYLIYLAYLGFYAFFYI